MKNFFVIAIGGFSTVAFSQADKFAQLYDEFATPNNFRNAAGAPGHEYYQQQANYVIQVTLDDEKQQIKGEETITYINNSPDPLAYLWLQLDQNIQKPDSDNNLTETGTIESLASPWAIAGRLKSMEFDGGYKDIEVTDVAGVKLPFTVVGTMMRIDLPKPIIKGGTFSFKVKWWFNINNRMELGGRSGYEYFQEEDNYLYTMAQFFPR
ncbi:MAG: M1 family peptidase, partial [Crocinitomicaceae bacterium]|nr:M1 family peptidase [Crocinitomicaceae bacterium]